MKDKYFVIIENKEMEREYKYPLYVFFKLELDDCIQVGRPYAIQSQMYSNMFGYYSANSKKKAFLIPEEDVLKFSENFVYKLDINPDLYVEKEEGISTDYSLEETLSLEFEDEKKQVARM